MALAPGCPDRGLERPDSVCGEDGVEGSYELRVAIADEELHLVRLVGEVHREVADLLGHPRGHRVGRDAGDPDATRVVMDEHEDVEPAEKDGVDMKEVAGDQTPGLRSEELRPDRSGSPR
ncbi:MAG: hypothetical protein M0Z46_02260 [Actinomycetota bacterium]|nr:hypothetical protein [Actinomycetota bacterium]